MTVLVADVGGTNTRIGMSDGGVVTQISRYENDAYPSFDAVVAKYLSDVAKASLTGAVIAVAGPVTSTRAKLTNRDWSFDSAQLRAALPGAPKVFLINDLVALGHALPHLAEGQHSTLLSGAEQPLNSQRVVAGVGTGFNVCLLRDGAVMEAELGHASLPSSVGSVLHDALGDGAAQFTTNEAVLSGRGLSRLYQVMTGRSLAGAQIIAAADAGDCQSAREAVMLFARLLGCFSRELVFQYLPFGGIHFAGGAARGVLGSDARDAFVAAFLNDGPFHEQVAQVPVHVIADDLAALIGAARFFERG
ncbi:glucokinase [Falsiruegeria mediterranea]|uniref:Glucokinase n=1 Tax=Falsiruegeria mediterranea M17 TaxID=1200281 RepID=A0A2R8C6V6_9RHOB|nr:glucokinase [Falsiruegeria mediterranea]SPJ28161.1 Glucokinase [Falsiruegeria mediterranea M17]